MINRITLELIDHSQQRYNTVGDWFIEGETLVIRGSRVVKNGEGWALNWAVPLHELVEALSALAVGITPAEVDEFDIAFEKRHSNDDLEPGDDPNCPVFRQHQFATHVEKIFVTEILGRSWDWYESIIDAPWLAHRKASNKKRLKNAPNPSSTVRTPKPKHRSGRSAKNRKN